MPRRRPKPPATHPDLFSGLKQNPHPLRKKTMDVKVPLDKSFQTSELAIGGTKIGKIEYYMEATSTPRRPIIKIQFLTPVEQGKKYGIRLLAHFLLQAKAQNVHQVVADVGEDNEASQRMFERMGFSMKRVTLGGYAREEGAGAHLYRYTLDLEHMGREGIIKRLATSLQENQKKLMQKRIATQNLLRPPKPKQ